MAHGLSAPVQQQKGHLHAKTSAAARRLRPSAVIRRVRPDLGHQGAGHHRPRRAKRRQHGQRRHVERQNEPAQEGGEKEIEEDRRQDVSQKIVTRSKPSPRWWRLFLYYSFKPNAAV